MGSRPRHSGSVAARLGEVSGEGGPFLLSDRTAIEEWHGTDGDGSDYGQVLATGPAGGAVRVGDASGVVWEPEGAATAVLYRLSGDELLLQREWKAEVPAPPPSPDAETIGHLDIVSERLVVLWSAASWSDLFDPPPVDGEGRLSMPAMLDIGIQVPAPNGRYRCSVRYSDEAYRCWIALA